MSRRFACRIPLVTRSRAPDLNDSNVDYSSLEDGDHRCRPLVAQVGLAVAQTGFVTPITQPMSGSERPLMSLRPTVHEGVIPP